MNDHLNSFNKLEFDRIKQHVQRYAVSDLGREHIDKLIPSSDVAAITGQLNLVSEMKQLLTSDTPFPIGAIADVRKSIQRSSIENYVLSPEELRSIWNVLTVTRKIKAYFTRKESTYPLLINEIDSIQIDKILEFNIAQAIDEEGNVLDTASKELGSIRKQLSEKAASLRRHLERILKNVAGNDWIQEEIITTREGRMVIPIKTEHKNRVNGFIHSSSASGATVFIEPTETLDINNDLRTLQFQEQREIEKILRALTAEVADSRELILRNIATFGVIDFLYAKAQYSIELLGSAPVVSADGPISLVNAYHPILLHRHARREVIPLSLTVGGDIKTLVITGPNAGGKSVAMKTAGLLILMTHAGCHIPAAPESIVKVLTDLFVETGDDQSIENDLSSFSSHLTNLKLIVEKANEGSLVLIDEIGSGTDPSEGASLAASILEHLTSANAITIVTTHHGTLKTFAYETPHVENCAMEFDQDTLTPTYRLMVGTPGSSYALEMAERLHLPESIIARATTLRGSDSMKLENLIEELERRNQELATHLQEVSEEKTKFKELNLLYESRLSSVKKELKEVKSQALREAELIVEKANVAIENAVREIKEHAASPEVIKAVRGKIRGIDAEFKTLRGELNPGPSEILSFHIGDSVKLRETESAGEIVSQLENGHYLVLAGTLKIKVHAGQLMHAVKSRAPIRQSQSIDFIKEGKRELDLRGMFGDEAILAIEKFFDDAILSGVTRVHLIHGKGTGALRRKIDEYLRKHRSIKSFRLGEWNEGGGGVTVVELE